MTILTAKERDEARYMVLDGEAVSEAALKVVEALSNGLVHQRRKRATSGYKRALAGILCDFLRAAEGGRWSYRPFRPNAFSGQRIGFRPFKAVIEGMGNSLMVELTKGQQQWVEGFDDVKSVSWSRATRLRPTEWLLRYMAEAGLTSDTWSDHFKLIEPTQSLVREPIVLRRRNVRHKGQKHRGYAMRVDRNDPKVRALQDRMDKLNRFYLKHSIEPSGFRGLRRNFNNGDAPGFDWDQGGRLYAVGGSYQTMKAELRPDLTIDGEPVVEIDVRASFISILSVMRGMPLQAHEDPYEVEGLPRPLVKAVVTMTLGHDRFHARWPSEVKQKLDEKLGVDIGKAYRLKKVLPMIVARLPAMEGWGTTNINCFDLQYIESEAMLLAVERLAYSHGVATFPVHDSLIVPRSHQELAKVVIGDAFEEVTGYRPQLKAG